MDGLKSWKKSYFLKWMKFGLGKFSTTYFFGNFHPSIYLNSQIALPSTRPSQSRTTLGPFCRGPPIEGPEAIDWERWGNFFHPYIDVFFSGELQSFWLINNKNLFVCVLIPSEKKNKKNTRTLTKQNLANESSPFGWLFHSDLTKPGRIFTWKNLHPTPRGIGKSSNPNHHCLQVRFVHLWGEMCFFYPQKMSSGGWPTAFVSRFAGPAKKPLGKGRVEEHHQMLRSPAEVTRGGGKGGNIFSSSLVLYMHRKFQRVDTRVRKWKNGEIYNIHPNKLANKQKISDWVNLFIIIFPYNLAQLASGMPCLESFHFIYFPLFEYESYQEWILSIFGSRN